MLTVQIQNSPRKVFTSLARAIQWIREVNPTWYQLEQDGKVIVSSQDSWPV